MEFHDESPVDFSSEVKWEGDYAIGSRACL